MKDFECPQCGYKESDYKLPKEVERAFDLISNDVKGEMISTVGIVELILKSKNKQVIELRNTKNFKEWFHAFSAIFICNNPVLEDIKFIEE